MQVGTQVKLRPDVVELRKEQHLMTPYIFNVNGTYHIQRYEGMHHEHNVNFWRLIGGNVVDENGTKIEIEQLMIPETALIQE